MRINSGPLKSVVEQTGHMLDAQGEIPRAPSALGGKSLSELLSSGEVLVDIDPKYPQSIGLRSILSQTLTLGNFTWDILLNGRDDSPFFTCDFPVAIEDTEDPRILNKLIPLPPHLAIRIRPNLVRDRKNFRFTFTSFRRTRRQCDRAEVVSINRRIVRCAETVVFFRDNFPWVPGFVRKNGGFRIKPMKKRIPHGTGTILWFTQEIRETKPATNGT